MKGEGEADAPTRKSEYQKSLPQAILTGKEVLTNPWRLSEGKADIPPAFGRNISLPRPEHVLFYLQALLSSFIPILLNSKPWENDLCFSKTLV